MNVTFKVGGNAARLCRADRHHRQHGDPRQGHPPRIPRQRGRRLQRAQGQAQPGPHPEPRLLPGQARDQADRRLGARPRRAWRQRRGESRPASCRLSGGYSSLEQFVVQLAVSQNNFMGKGQELDASVNWSRYAKSVQLGFVEPYFLDKPILLGGQHLPPRLPQLQFHRERQPQHDLFADQHRRRLADSASRSPNIGPLRRPLQPGPGQGLARQEHLLHRPRRQPGR